MEWSHQCLSSPPTLNTSLDGRKSDSPNQMNHWQYPLRWADCDFRVPRKAKTLLYFVFPYFFNTLCFASFCTVLLVVVWVYFIFYKVFMFLFFIHFPIFIWLLWIISLFGNQIFLALVFCFCFSSPIHDIFLSYFSSLSFFFLYFFNPLHPWLSRTHYVYQATKCWD